MSKQSKETEGKQEVAVREREPQLQRFTPARALSPFEEIDHLLENVFPRRWLRPWQRAWPDWNELAAPFEGRYPRVDVIDRDDEIMVRAEVPGVEKQDLDVSMTDDTLTIKGSAKREEKEEKGDYYRCEISRGGFARTVLLPSNVDGTKARAMFKDGILEVVLPKAEKSKRRTIAVD
jgi:HSP20 family protein